jgi:hypothetical protein
MPDRETVRSVATEIIVWQSAAQQLPLPELRTMMTDWQLSLAASLDVFNDVCRNHAGHDECTDVIQEAITDVARQATATAIFILGVSQRTHKAAHHN